MTTEDYKNFKDVYDSWVKRLNIIFFSSHLKRLSRESQAVIKKQKFNSDKNVFFFLKISHNCYLSKDYSIKSFIPLEDRQVAFLYVNKAKNLIKEIAKEDHFFAYKKPLVEQAIRAYLLHRIGQILVSREV